MYIFILIRLFRVGQVFRSRDLYNKLFISFLIYFLWFPLSFSIPPNTLMLNILWNLHYLLWFPLSFPYFIIAWYAPVIIIESWTKGISNRPWPNEYNWIMNQMYKVWTSQERISDKFTVLEEPKEEQSLTFSDFYSIISLKHLQT